MQLACARWASLSGTKMSRLLVASLAALPDFQVKSSPSQIALPYSAHRSGRCGTTEGLIGSSRRVQRRRPALRLKRVKLLPHDPISFATTTSVQCSRRRSRTEYPVGVESSSRCSSHSSSFQLPSHSPSTQQNGECQFGRLYLRTARCPAVGFQFELYRSSTLAEHSCQLD